MPDIRATTDDIWVKSSYSNAGQNCIEIANVMVQPPQVGVRDSKDVQSPGLLVPATSWTSFVRNVQSGRLGRGPVG